MKIDKKSMILFKVFLLGISLTLSLLTSAAENTKTESTPKKAKVESPIVVFETTLGDLKFELYPEKAPKTVKNFLKYVDSGFYDGIIFHRVIDGFMVQTGGFTQEYAKKRNSAPIMNESDNGLKNLRGTLSMARTNHPHSASSQFFINLVDNASLDFRAGRLGMPDQHGYAVFGKVIEGIEVTEKIAKLPQGKHARKGRGEFVNAPNNPVVINKAFRAPK